MFFRCHINEILHVQSQISYLTLCQAWTIWHDLGINCYTKNIVKNCKKMNIFYTWKIYSQITPSRFVTLKVVIQLKLICRYCNSKWEWCDILSNQVWYHFWGKYWKLSKIVIFEIFLFFNQIKKHVLQVSYKWNFACTFTHPLSNTMPSLNNMTRLK